MKQYNSVLWSKNEEVCCRRRSLEYVCLVSPNLHRFDGLPASRSIHPLSYRFHLQSVIGEESQRMRISNQLNMYGDKYYIDIMMSG